MTVSELVKVRIFLFYKMCDCNVYIVCSKYRGAHYVEIAVPHLCQNIHTVILLH